MTKRKSFDWLNENSRLFLDRGYLMNNQTPEERLQDIADHAERLTEIEGFSEKFYDYMSKGYYSLSSPVWSNFGTERGLPVSCFGSFINDNMSSILKTQAEIGMLTRNGGGNSLYAGNIRPRGSTIKNNGTTFGSVHFMELFQTLTTVVSQGSMRRGFCSPYLPIEHDDAEEFINIASEGHPIQHLTHGVSIGNDYINSMLEGDVEKRKMWAKVLQRRGENGFPYIFFRDTINNNTVDVYKDKNMPIHASNMCSEIALPSSENETFVCVLSSMNVLYYDEWKDTDAVETLAYFLDSVVTEFLNKLEEMRDSSDVDKNDSFKFMERAYNFAKNHRALGMGILGWHSYLQSNMIPFESKDAKNMNKEIMKHIEKYSWKASKNMAKQYGEPEVLKGYGRRNTTLTAIAPTKSSSFILGQVSQSIEPEFSNYYVKDLAKTRVTIKNKYLEKLLEEKDQNIYETWDSIRKYNGSVQHLNFLSDEEKDVFKTFSEIDPYSIISQAADRQKHLDQSQSLNLMFDNNTTPKQINKIYLDAWRKGVKTLYYQFAQSAAQNLTRKKSQDCASCEA